MSETVEYRVRPVTRFVVTSYHNQRHNDGRQQSGTSRQHGEFDNAETAYAVGYALARADHERLGYSIGDERVRYPDPIHLGAPAAVDPRTDVAAVLTSAPSRPALNAPFALTYSERNGFASLTASWPARDGEGWRRGNDVTDGDPAEVRRWRDTLEVWAAQLGREPTAEEVDQMRFKLAAAS